MTAFTWSSSRTMSPMTTVCLPARLNAAHDVSPMGGVSLTPAATTVRSLRGTDTLNTPSMSLSTPLPPVSSSILPVSNDACGGPASAADAEASVSTAMKVRMVSSEISLRDFPLPGCDGSVFLLPAKILVEILEDGGASGQALFVFSMRHGNPGHQSVDSRDLRSSELCI